MVWTYGAIYDDKCSTSDNEMRAGVAKSPQFICIFT